MSKTQTNLKEAFAGESQANQRYLSFAEQAEKDGFPQVARLFRAAAYAEKIHAANHLKAMGGINPTAENLQAAIDGENYEVVSMYPEFIKAAEEEALKRPLTSFKWAYEVEKVHEGLYRRALEMLGEDMPETDYYVCPFCGFTHEGPCGGNCPVCGAPGEKFTRVS
jgi:rubrerythrin